ncbi:hypothetical protein BJV78DRAFT_1355597 [Lactifluus subvellereus]|nr:hypothetical protein BJV78DRAFT_1355597 [Lactifluus subvellereus]
MAIQDHPLVLAHNVSSILFNCCGPGPVAERDGNSNIVIGGATGPRTSELASCTGVGLTVQAGNKFPTCTGLHRLAATLHPRDLACSKPSSLAIIASVPKIRLKKEPNDRPQETSPVSTGLSGVLPDLGDGSGCDFSEISLRPQAAAWASEFESRGHKRSVAYSHLVREKLHPLNASPALVVSGDFRSYSPSCLLPSWQFQLGVGKHEAELLPT